MWWRDAVATATWQQIDMAYSIVGLAATNGKLFAVTADNKLWWRNAIGTVSPWQQIDMAYQIVSMTALNNNEKAKTFFDTLSKSNRYSIGFQLQTAKREETKTRRIMQIIEKLEQEEKSH